MLIKINTYRQAADFFEIERDGLPQDISFDDLYDLAASRDGALDLYMMICEHPRDLCGSTYTLSDTVTA